MKNMFSYSKMIFFEKLPDRPKAASLIHDVISTRGLSKDAEAKAAKELNAKYSELMKKHLNQNIDKSYEATRQMLKKEGITTQAQYEELALFCYKSSYAALRMLAVILTKSDKLVLSIFKDDPDANLRFFATVKAGEQKNVGMLKQMKRYEEARGNKKDAKIIKWITRLLKG